MVHNLGWRGFVEEARDRTEWKSLTAVEADGRTLRITAGWRVFLVGDG